MAKLVIMITSRIDAGYDIGEAWQTVGAPGVTLINSYGLHRMQQTSKTSDIIPDIMSMLDMVRDRHENNLILLSIVQNAATADRLIAAADEILGGFSSPDSGLIFTIDLETVVGLKRP